MHNQLTSIWRLNNGGSSEKLARFVYDSNNNITGVYDEAGRETLFYYNTSGGIRYLDYVVYPDGAKADYTYNTYGMTCAYDQEANYGICYTYDSDGTVNQFYEYYLSGTTHVIGNIVSCWNGLNRASYRDWGADHVLCLQKRRTFLPDTQELPQRHRAMAELWFSKGCMGEYKRCYGICVNKRLNL